MLTEPSFFFLKQHLTDSTFFYVRNVDSTISQEMVIHQFNIFVESAFL
jgi:hypothetical protein